MTNLSSEVTVKSQGVTDASYFDKSSATNGDILVLLSKLMAFFTQNQKSSGDVLCDQIQKRLSFGLIAADAAKGALKWAAIGAGVMGAATILGGACSVVCGGISLGSIGSEANAVGGVGKNAVQEGSEASTANLSAGSSVEMQEGTNAVTSAPASGVPTEEMGIEEELTVPSSASTPEAEDASGSSQINNTQGSSAAKDENQIQQDKNQIMNQFKGKREALYMWSQGLSSTFQGVGQIGSADCQNNQGSEEARKQIASSSEGVADSVSKGSDGLYQNLGSDVSNSGGQVKSVNDAILASAEIR